MFVSVNAERSFILSHFRPFFVFFLLFLWKTLVQFSLHQRHEANIPTNYNLFLSHTIFSSCFLLFFLLLIALSASHITIFALAPIYNIQQFKIHTRENRTQTHWIQKYKSRTLWFHWVARIISSIHNAKALISQCILLFKFSISNF